MRKKWGTGKKTNKQPNYGESSPPKNLKGEVININNMKLNKKVAKENPLKPSFPKIHIDKNKPVIMCYTDGGVQGNGKEINKGSYAFILVEDGKILKEYSKAVNNTTNNKMELQAIIDCLEYIEENRLYDVQIVLHSDSQYCIHGICSWRHGWIKKDWKDVKNVEQWKWLSNLVNLLPNVQYKWIRAHQEDDSQNTKWNNYVDQLCQNEIGYTPIQARVYTSDTMDRFMSRSNSERRDKTELQMNGWDSPAAQEVIKEQVLRTPFGSEKCVVVPIEQLKEADQLLLELHKHADLTWEYKSLAYKVQEYLTKNNLI